MALWSALYPFILPQVRGCDTDVIDFHARQATIEFCARSQAWRQEIPIVAIANTPTYLIPMPTDAVASMLLDFDMLDIDGNSTDQYHVLNPNRGRRVQRDDRWASFVYLSDDGLSLTVQPTPDSADLQLVPYLSLKPTQSAATLPDVLMAQDANVIANGTLARLLSMQKVAWTDKAQGMTLRTEFLADCGAAAVRASRGNARSQTRSRGCFF